MFRIDSESADILTAFINARKGKTVIVLRVCPLFIKIHNQAFISMKNAQAHHIGATMEANMKGLLDGFVSSSLILIDEKNGKP